MTGYVVVPENWRSKPDATKAWIQIALELTTRMPPKAAGGKKLSAKKPARPAKTR
jgi:hypothetical protein